MFIKKKIIYAISSLSFLMVNVSAAAELEIPIEKMSIAALLKMILGAILDLAIPIIVLAIVYVGFLFVKAQGNDGELTKAKEALTWVLIGTAVVIGSNAAYNIIYTAL